MPIDEVDLAPWTRKHDDPALPVTADSVLVLQEKLGR